MGDFAKMLKRGGESLVPVMLPASAGFFGMKLLRRAFFGKKNRSVSLE